MVKFFVPVMDADPPPKGYKLCWFDRSKCVKVACPRPFAWILSRAAHVYTSFTEWLELCR